MTSIADSSVKIQTTSQSNPSPPSWFGEAVLLISSLRQHDVLSKISERVRFARRRFGHDEVIDFLAVLFGYARSFERTLEEFYRHLQLESHVQVSSMNSSSPRCRKRASPLAMWSNCIGILGPLNLSLLTKIRRSTRIDGGVIALAVKRHGVSSANGCGTCVWRWDMS